MPKTGIIHTRNSRRQWNTWIDCRWPIDNGDLIQLPEVSRGSNDGLVIPPFERILIYTCKFRYQIVEIFMKHQKQFHQIFSNCTLSIKISNQHRDFLTKFNISMKNSRNYAPSWKNVQFPHIYIYFFKFAPNVTNAIVIVCHKIDSLAISVNVKFQNDLRTKCPYRCLNVSSDCKFIYGVGQTPPQIFPNNFTAISFLRSWK